MERGLLVGDCWAYREFHTWQRVANCLASPRMVDPHSLLLTHYVGTLFPENKPGQAQFPYLPGAKWQDKESKTPEDFFLSVDGPYKSLKLREYWPKKNKKQNKTKKTGCPCCCFPAECVIRLSSSWAVWPWRASTLLVLSYIIVMSLSSLEVKNPYEYIIQEKKKKLFRMDGWKAYGEKEWKFNVFLKGTFPWCCRYIKWKPYV